MMETIQNHKREFGIGAIILAVLLIFSFYEYHEKKQAELAASQLELNGNVDLREVSLAFRNSDRITEILVDEGDTVKKSLPRSIKKSVNLLMRLTRKRKVC